MWVFFEKREKEEDTKGAYVTVPVGVPHTFVNTGNAPMRFLNTFTPTQYLNYFFELSELMTRSGVSTPVQMRELMTRYQTEVVGV